MNLFPVAKNGIVVKLRGKSCTRTMYMSLDYMKYLLTQLALYYAVSNIGRAVIPLTNCRMLIIMQCFLLGVTKISDGEIYLCVTQSI